MRAHPSIIALAVAAALWLWHEKTISPTLAPRIETHPAASNAEDKIQAPTDLHPSIVSAATAHKRNSALVKPAYCAFETSTDEQQIASMFRELQQRHPELLLPAQDMMLLTATLRENSRLAALPLSGLDEGKVVMPGHYFGKTLDELQAGVERGDALAQLVLGTEKAFQAYRNVSKGKAFNQEEFAEGIKLLQLSYAQDQGDALSIVANAYGFAARIVWRYGDDSTQSLWRDLELHRLASEKLQLMAGSNAEYMMGQYDNNYLQREQEKTQHYPENMKLTHSREIDALAQEMARELGTELQPTLSAEKERLAAWINSPSFWHLFEILKLDCAAPVEQRS